MLLCAGQDAATPSTSWIYDQITNDRRFACKVDAVELKHFHDSALMGFDAMRFTSCKGLGKSTSDCIPRGVGL